MSNDDLPSSPQCRAARHQTAESPPSMSSQQLTVHGTAATRGASRYTATSVAAAKNGHGDDLGLAARQAGGAGHQSINYAQGGTGRRNQGRRGGGGGRNSSNSSSSGAASISSTSERHKPAASQAHPQDQLSSGGAGTGVGKTAGLAQSATQYPGRRQRRADRSAGANQQGSQQRQPARSGNGGGRPSLGGSKTRKIVPNEFLGFNYSRTPGGDEDEPVSTYGSRGGYGHHRGGGSQARKPARHAKEQYLQASCQFIVSNDRNFAECTSAFDPDKMVDWDAVHQLNMYTNELPVCPICLSLPRAAKITRCGHIYCWHCVLQYLSYEMEPFHKCPICPQKLVEKDLKSVRMICAPEPDVNEIVTFRLVKRRESSVLVSPHVPRDVEPSPDEDMNRFSKLVAVTNDCVLSRIVNRELEELNAMLQTMSDDASCDLQMPFVRQAIDVCKEKQKTLRSSTGTTPASSSPSSPTLLHRTPSKSPASSSTTAVKTPVQSAEDAAAVQLARLRMWSDEDEDTNFPALCSTAGNAQQEGASSLDATMVAASSPSAEAADHCEESADGSGATDVAASALCADGSWMGSPAASLTEKVLSGEGATAEEPYVFYYQATNSQHLYINRFCLHVLKEEFGKTLENAPLTLTARILEQKKLSMDETKRDGEFRLFRLPISCQFTMCEVDLKAIVSKDTYDMFAETIHQHETRRRKEERDRRRKDREARKKADRQAKAKSAGYQNPLYLSSGTSAPQPIPSASTAGDQDVTEFAGGHTVGSVGSVNSDGSSTSSLPSSYQEEPAPLSMGSPLSSGTVSYSQATNSAASASASAVPAWPRRPPGEASTAAQPPPSKTRTGPAASAGQRGRSTAAAAAAVADLSDEELVAPSYKTAFLCDSLFADGNAVASTDTGKKGKKAKGRRKNAATTLFSTASRHGQ